MDAWLVLGIAAQAQPVAWDWPDGTTWTVIDVRSARVDEEPERAGAVQARWR